MDREYKAFISYRHLPLDMAVAKKVHRSIEHYLIPRSLRKNGKKKLGLVFRDQDELPISGTLSENIQTALDHSEFLIVICTPETSKSMWVEAEIRYFLETHDRDHVLAVLADGRPAEAFPPQLTEVYSPDGDVMSRAEPLAANIAADSAAKRNRLFRTEILRILAALIGCAFDELYRREQRYRARRFGAAAAAVLLVAMGFIGMLLNRNAEIRRQLLAAQINESKALAARSLSQFREGDYNGALRTALQALPSPEDDRPYVAEAEDALARELDLYSDSTFVYARTIDQPTNIRMLTAAEGGKLLITCDGFDHLRCYSVPDGVLRWERTVFEEDYRKGSRDVRYLYSVDGCGGVIVSAAGYGCMMLSCEDGSVLWEREDADCDTLSEDRSLWLGEANGDGAPLCVFKSSDGSQVYAFPKPGEETDSLFAAGLSSDGKTAAVLVCRKTEEPLDLYRLDMRQKTALKLSGEIPFSYDANYEIRVTPEDRTYLVMADIDAPAQIWGFGADGEELFSTATDSAQKSGISSAGFLMAGDAALFDCRSDAVVFGGRNCLYACDPGTGQKLWSVNLSGDITAAAAYPNGTYGIVQEDGIITFCSKNGTLSSDMMMYYANLDYDLRLAVVWGDMYLTGGFAAVPMNCRSRIAVILPRSKGDLRLLAEEGADYPPGARLYSSPSGGQLCCVSYDYNREALRGVLLSPEEDYAATAVDLSSDFVGLSSSKTVWLTDDGDLILGGTRYGLKTGEIDKFCDVYSVFSCSDSQNSRILTAALNADPSENGGWRLWIWSDGRPLQSVPVNTERGRPDCIGIDGTCAVVDLNSTDKDDRTGCLVYSAETQTWTELAPGLKRGDAFCVTHDGTMLARQKLTGETELLSLTGGKSIWSTDCGIPAGSEARLLFSDDDAYLIVFSAQGQIRILNRADGEVLHSSFFGEVEGMFTSTARYSCQELFGGERLLIVCDNSSFTTPWYMTVETETWCRIGSEDCIRWYDACNDRLLLYHDLDGIYASPVLTLEDLRSRALEILEPSGGPES